MEAGAGAASLMTPTYRGSGNYGVISLPFPYFAYRGDQVRMTRSGLRVRGADWVYFSLSMSGAVTVPADDGEDPAREDMPDVEPTLEVGPSFDWTLSTGDWSWCLCVPVRAATSTDLSHWENAGWLTHPQVRAQRYFDEGTWTLSTTYSLGAVFATHRYHARFYDVAAEYATAERPEYYADGGYSGMRAALFIGVRRQHWSGGIGIVGDWLDGAAFDGSPLLREDTSMTAGIAIAYSFWQQGTIEQANDDP